MIRSIHSFSFGIAVALTWPLMLGCQGREASVSGTLTTQEGLPLVGARITVRNSETGDWATGVTDSRGHYELGSDPSGTGVMPGEYYVTVIEGREDWDNPAPPQVHAKYSKPATSGLRLALEPGERKAMDLSLEAPGGKAR
jgi:hypothetical protein